MIIYNVFANHGGMLRVTESMKDIFDYLPESFPLRVVIFSNRPWPDFDPQKFIWIPWDDADTKMVSKEGTEHYKNLIREHFQGTKIDLVIGDTFTLRYWEDFDVPFCYDAHYLDRPFYEAFHSYPDIYLMDQYSPNAICHQLNTAELFSYKREGRFMGRCSVFLANSHSTLRHYEEYYAEFTQDKSMYVVPVSTGLEASVSNVSPTLDLYYSGRFHPQKGLHFLFKRKKTDRMITFRGFDPRIIPQEAWSNWERLNFKIQPWTTEAHILIREIQQAKVMLFPSIYEPWGLSLQEALSMGKICVAHRSKSGHEEQIQHGENGFLLDLNDESWEEEVEAILNLEPTERKRISQNAMESTPSGHRHRLKKLAEVLQELESDFSC